ncbi:MAG: hypothetical protein HY840_13530 [Bacteroidetes bacterium]|nr:hypothetical protein [Bacteroidota bacterium]
MVKHKSKATGPFPKGNEPGNDFREKYTVKNKLMDLLSLSLSLSVNAGILLRKRIVAEVCYKRGVYIIMYGKHYFLVFNNAIYFIPHRNPRNKANRY